MSALPPMPKLRPRPGLQQQQSQQQQQQQLKNKKQNKSHDVIMTSSQGDFTRMQQQQQQQQQQQHDVVEEGTSKLLMKSGFGGRGGRRGGSSSNSGGTSLVHSIPKFSQVRPTEKLAEVQKVLQSRIISKQMEKKRQQMLLQQHQLQQQQQQHQVNLGNLEIVPVKAARLHQQDFKLAPPPLEALNSNRVVMTERERLQATSSELNRHQVAISSRRRGRKPAKDAICHLVTTNPAAPVNNKIIPVPEVTISKVASSPNINPEVLLPAGIPVLSEVTITPSSPSKSEITALDLTSKSRKKYPATINPDVVPEVIEIDAGEEHPLPPMLYPQDYDRLGGPPGYVFCPETNVFVHPSALQTHLARMEEKQRQIPLKKRAVSKQPPTSSSLSSTPSSSTSVIKSIAIKNNKRKSSDGNSEVSISKFKFTGGDRPSLEERKTLSVDSVGNLKFSNNSQKGLPRSSLAALGVIGAFEALPDKK